MDVGRVRVGRVGLENWDGDHLLGEIGEFDLTVACGGGADNGGGSGGEFDCHVSDDYLKELARIHD